MKRVLLLVVCLLACGGGSGDDDDGDGAAADAAIPTDPLIEARPYDIYVPVGYDPATPMPLVLFLHGYMATGYANAAVWYLFDAADRHGFLVAYPNGTVDSQGHQFWNATDGCCNRDGSTIDDVAYLTAVLDDVDKRYNVDPKRVYVTGHSNGGFMSHRMGCELSERIAAIVSLAGMTWQDPADCPAAAHVSVLQVHGDADEIIPYDGYEEGGVPIFPSAPQTVATWAAKNGCSGALGAPEATRLDLVADQPGADTRVERTVGCPADGAAELWTIEGGSHIPSFDSTAWADAIWAFMDAHPKP